MLSAQRSRASGWGLLNYANYNDVDREHQPLWADLLATKISVRRVRRSARPISGTAGMGKK